MNTNVRILVGIIVVLAIACSYLGFAWYAGRQSAATATAPAAPQVANNGNAAANTATTQSAADPHQTLRDEVDKLVTGQSKMQTDFANLEKDVKFLVEALKVDRNANPGTPISGAANTASLPQNPNGAPNPALPQTSQVTTPQGQTAAQNPPGNTGANATKSYLYNILFYDEQGRVQDYHTGIKEIDVSGGVITFTQESGAICSGTNFLFKTYPRAEDDTPEKKLLRSQPRLYEGPNGNHGTVYSVPLEETFEVTTRDNTKYIYFRHGKQMAARKARWVTLSGNPSFEEGKFESYEFDITR
jgi:hypothetical protein